MKRAGLTKMQLRALSALSDDGPASSYEVRVPVTTYYALSKRGLIKVTELTISSVVFPHRAVACITPAGLAALQEARNAEG